MKKIGISGDQLKVKRNRSIQMTRRISRWNRRSSLRNLKNGGGTKEIEVVYPKFEDPILLIKPEQVDDILKEIKRIETRSQRTKKSKGTRIFLSKTGTGEIQGYAYLDVCFDFESSEEWEKLRKYHQVSDRMGKRDKGWCFSGTHTYDTPIPYTTWGGEVFCRFKSRK